MTPAGPWKEIDWIAAGPAFPQEPVAGSSDDSYVMANVFSWSRGYVGFRTVGRRDATPTATSPAPGLQMVSTTSTDGLHWTAGRPVPLPSGIADLGYRDLVQSTADQRTVAAIRRPREFATPPETGVAIMHVVEGPAGLLATGSYPRGTCGGPWTVDVLWFSSDGVAWKLVSLPAGWNSVAMVSAGPAGYLAVAPAWYQAKPALWVSSDGQTWTRGSVPGSAISVEEGLVLSDGFLVSGSSREIEGCGVTSEMPSVWWSPDARAWTRAVLPGANLSAGSWVHLARISQKSLLAIASEFDASGNPVQQMWLSSDGHAWSLVKSPSVLIEWTLLTDGQRGLVLGVAATGDLPLIASVDDDLTVTILPQSGNGPAQDDTYGPGTVAFGSTGVVVVSRDGTRLWLGVPIAR